MKQYEQLDKLIADYGGVIQTYQVVAEGISKPTFYNYVKVRKLEQVAHGVYVLRDAWTDSLYLIHLRCEQAIFSHETALFFHDLTDREPAPYSITVKTGYNPTRLKADGIHVYTVKSELHPVGRTTAQTSFGVVRQIKSTTIRHFILTGIAEKRSNKAYYKHLIRQIK